jgi:hypothetical protein
VQACNLKASRKNLISSLILALLLLLTITITAAPHSARIPREKINPQDPQSCTIFTATVGSTVFFGNNEDYRLWGTYAWFVPSQEIQTPTGARTIHGAIFFGFDENGDPADGYPQGGMNDQGLCLDGNGLSDYSINPHYERPPPYAALLAELLWDCATVGEVILWFQTHTIGDNMAYQLHFADATGDAVVVSAGPDNEIAFTRINAASYIISTNINVADPTRDVFDCWRFSTATNMLASINTESELTVEACRDVLDAVHQNGQYATKYSNIFDPVHRLIYLYYDRNYEEVATLSLDVELAQVQPTAPDYYEQDPLFHAYSADGDIHYRQTELTDLFTTPSPPPSPPILLLASISLIVPIIIVISLFYFKKYRLKHTEDSPDE